VFAEDAMEPIVADLLAAHQASKSDHAFETKVLEALSRIGKTGKAQGYECPKCHRLLLLKTGEISALSYKPEQSAPRDSSLLLILRTGRKVQGDGNDQESGE